MVTLRDGGDTATDSALFKMARVEFKYLIFYYLMSNFTFFRREVVEISSNSVVVRVES